MYSYLMQKPEHISPAIPYMHAQSQRERLDVAMRSWLKTATRNWKRRKMIAELEAMDDHLLLDIGIPRRGIRKAINSWEERELGMTRR